MKPMSVREQLPEGRNFVLNLETGPVRPVHLDLLPAEHFGSLMIHFSEEAYVIVSRVPPHSSGPLPHWHDADQLFCCVEGRLELRLGAEDVVLSPGDLAVIPAGTRHAHRNPSDRAEIHLELLLPGIVPGRPIVHRVEPDEDWTETGRVVRADDGAGGPDALWVAEAGADADAHWMCALVDVDAGSRLDFPAVPAAQRWYVLEGSVDVAASAFSGTARAPALIALAAETEASLRPDPGGRVRALGLWPALDDATASQLRARLTGRDAALPATGTVA